VKAASFDYHRAESVPDVIGRLELYEGTARVLAGGQSLVPMLNMRLWRPAALIDINGLTELAAITAHGELTTLGALVRYSTIERSGEVARRLPLLAQVVTHIGDRQVRNRGTIGGSLVQADPTGELPLACLVLDATVRSRGVQGVREIPVSQLYTGAYATVLGAGELLTDVIFPQHPQHFAFVEVGRRHNDFAMVSVVATGNRSADGTWSGLRIGLGGVADGPVLAADAALLLDGTDLADALIAESAQAALDVIDPPSDIRASAEYRRHLVPIHVRRVLTELRDAAEGAAQRQDRRLQTGEGR
jgi:carbon-monoxide dehydrogenase medium subunit